MCLTVYCHSYLTFRINRKGKRCWQKSQLAGRVTSKSLIHMESYRRPCGIIYATTQSIQHREISDSEVLERCMYTLINEGRREVNLLSSYASSTTPPPAIGFKHLESSTHLVAEDIDLMFVRSYGFPASKGGPMWWSEKDIGLVRENSFYPKLLLSHPPPFPGVSTSVSRTNKRVAACQNSYEHMLTHTNPARHCQTEVVLGIIKHNEAHAKSCSSQEQTRPGGAAPTTKDLPDRWVASTLLKDIVASGSSITEELYFKRRNAR